MAEIESINGNPIVAEVASESIQPSVDAWLAAHPEVTTTVQDNSVSDAKLVQTDGALSGHLARANDRIPMKVIKNQYINNRGAINNYNGWDRTDYMNVRGLRSIKVTASEASNYNAFYDESKTMIGSSSDVIHVVQGETVVDVPAAAVYAIFSGTESYIAGLSVAAVSTNDEQNISRHTELVQTDLLCRQQVVFKPSDFTMATNIYTDGTQYEYNSAASTDEYWPILHTVNKYKFECEGYQVLIAEYVKKQDGTFAFLKLNDYVSNSGTLWCTTGTTHIRVAFKTNGNNNMNSTYAQSYLRDFCEKFVMREGRDLNSYLRVCTFNMARDYASLTGADSAGIQKQILNYLNFIGQYDPDVIQAQEAGGEYWDDGNTKNMNSTVFSRKYEFRLWPMHNRKTWSKYNCSEPTTITLAATYDGKTRSYTKMFLHLDDKVICLLNAHCEYEGTFAECRQLQFQELATEMAQHEYCILCGDFNAYSPSEFSEFSGFNVANCGEYGNIDTWHVDGDYPSWPNKCVDNIITTANIRIQNVVRGPYDIDYFSDHAPLLADLRVM